ncbi:MAG: hypothetical protein APF77_02545 [Clostridia bacterium BRH_c25]|nr:MAG: hypothetical protein APF77_02545 [Clostridia bacterium BRH_c25]
MNNRADHKKQQSEKFRNKLKKALAIFFCIALLVFSINVTDMSTRKMIMCNDDKYAMAVALQEDSMLRLDIAGEKLMLNVEPLVKAVDHVVSSSKRYYESFVKTIRTKLGK